MELENMGNNGILNTPQISRTAASRPDIIYRHAHDIQTSIEYILFRIVMIISCIIKS